MSVRPQIRMCALRQPIQGHCLQDSVEGQVDVCPVEEFLADPKHSAQAPSASVSFLHFSLPDAPR
jgi:hypothetical protein